MLELQRHKSATFTTLTYDEPNKPPTLRKRDLQLFLKRFRKEMAKNGQPIRFLASGEYGEQTYRPHYHAILYGAHETDADTINYTWRLGHTTTVPANPATIAYTAGYTSKKIDDAWRYQQGTEQIDYDTGEIYNWQAPFLQMSRRPGIGAFARQYTASWRDFAILNDQKQKVPRYLHDAWKQAATPEQIEQLAYETYQKHVATDKTTERLMAAEQIAIANQKIKANRRTL